MSWFPKENLEWMISHVTKAAAVGDSELAHMKEDEVLYWFTNFAWREPGHSQLQDMAGMILDMKKIQFERWHA